MSAFAELIGCPLPLQLAGMTRVSDAPLAAAVSNAGGLGMLGIGRLPAASLGLMLEDAVLTDLFDVGWPEAPVRVVSWCIAAAVATTDEIVGTITMPGGMTADLSGAGPHRRRSPPPGGSTPCRPTPGVPWATSPGASQPPTSRPS